MHALPKITDMLATIRSESTWSWYVPWYIWQDACRCSISVFAYPCLRSPRLVDPCLAMTNGKVVLWEVSALQHRHIACSALMFFSRGFTLKSSPTWCVAQHRAVLQSVIVVVRLHAACASVPHGINAHSLAWRSLKTSMSVVRGSG